MDGCRRIALKRRGLAIGDAELVVSDARDDLAVLRHAARSPAYLKVRIGDPLRAAESVTVFGFPLSGVLSSGGNTTLGNITALSGLGDDARYFQLSAPVQPGSSGGPVLDARGRLVGIVVSKLDALRVAGITGDIPQNVNFAIKAATLAAFLEAQGVRFETDVAGAALDPTRVAEIAAEASVAVECVR